MNYFRQTNRVEFVAWLADAIEPGYLIYTNQPWHPQLEFIAHVLRNREANVGSCGAGPRRRWTARAPCGFEKLEMEIDQWECSRFDRA